MKIRIGENQIILRLELDEIQQLIEKGTIQNKLNFPETTLRWTLSSYDQQDVFVRYEGTSLHFLFPKNQLAHWAHSSKVGFHHQISPELLLVIEKDMPKRGQKKT